MNKPVALMNHRNYVGYQIGFKMKETGKTAEEVFDYAVKVVTSWINEKMESSTEPIKPYENANLEDGFEVQVRYNEKYKAWASRLKHSDYGASTHEAVVGRFFITETAIKLTDDNVFFQCVINVCDPLDAKEVPFAFRPAFIREFLEKEGMIITQSEDILPISKKVLDVSDDNDWNKLKKLVDSGYNTLPVVIFTKNEGRFCTDVQSFADNMFGYAHTVIIHNDTEFFKKFLDDFIIETEKLYKPGDVVLLYPKYAAKGCMKTHIFDCGWLKDNNHLAKMHSVVEKNGHIDSEGEIPDVVKAFNKSISLNFAAHKIGDNYLDKHFRVMFVSEIDKKVRNEEIEESNKKINTLKKQLEASSNSSQKEIEAKMREMEEEIRKQIGREYENKIEELEFQKMELEYQNEELQKELNEKNHVFEGITSKPVRPQNYSNQVVLNTSNIKEFYNGEIYDFIHTLMAREIKDQMKKENKYRTVELAEQLLELNPEIGEGRETFKQIKNILFGEKNINERLKAKLNDLGLEMSERYNSQGHITVTFQGKSRYRKQFAATGSDCRGNKNACSDFLKAISVYDDI